MKFTNTAKEEAPTGGTFTPLTPGWYEATVYDVEVVEYSKKDGYEGKNVGWNVQYRISGDQEGAGRAFFQRIYVGDTKFPSGSANFTLFDFGDAVTGGKFRAEWNKGGADLPERENIMGATLDIKLKTGEYNGEARSEVASIRTHAGANNTVKATRAKASGKAELKL